MPRRRHRAIGFSDLVGCVSGSQDRICAPEEAPRSRRGDAIELGTKVLTWHHVLWPGGRAGKKRPALEWTLLSSGPSSLSSTPSSSSLLLVAGIVLVRTVISFLSHWSAFPQTVVGAIDGILVVIILLDIAHTVFGHLRSSVFPVRPFLVIGILAGVRDILSASAHLTLTSLTTTDLYDTLISLGVGVGVVVFLLVGLLLLGLSGHNDEDEET